VIPCFGWLHKAWIGSVDISIKKAWTARAFDISTKELAELSQSGDQFFQLERLHQIVIGAAAQPADAILQSPSRREHKDRQRILALPELSQDCQSVPVGQSQIEDQGGVGGRQQRSPGFRGVARGSVS